jgi:pimeloyl-ACP methyl ester carboxylesterase
MTNACVARLLRAGPLILFPLGLLTAVLAQPPAPTAPPVPPGRLVDLGGRRLHLHASGTGSPAVIVENGAGGFSVEWALVQPAVAKFTTIGTYDRAGYAWSDRGPTQDTIEQTIDDLHLLLRKAGLRPPYVLVGASLGSIYARAYQRRFPEQIVGLVFVDGTHDEAITFLVDGKRKPISHLSAEELQGAYQQYERDAPRPKAGPADQEPLNRLPPDLQKARHWAFAKLVREVGRLPRGADAAESWRQEFTALRRQRLAAAHPLGDLPLIVLERTQDPNATWHAQQTELAALSSAGKRVQAEASGHLIHLYRPEVVVQAIREVVTTARGKE